MEVNPPPGQSQPSGSGLSSTEIGALDIYSIFFIAISFSLIVYLSTKIFRLFRGSSNLEHQRRNTKYRLYIYSLIIISESIRVTAQSIELYNLIKKGEIFNENFYWVVQNSPSLLTFTIACVFAYFWHEVYRGFDDSYEDIERSNNNVKNLIIGLNIPIYLGFGVVSALFLIYGTVGYLIATISIVLGAIVIGSGLLIFHGYRLHRRVMRLMQITAQTVKSSMGFTIMFRVTVFCCFIKIMNLVFLDYEVISNSGNLLAGILDMSSTAFNIAIAMNAACCLLGELGLFFSLVVLLEIHAKKAKSSFINSDVSTMASMKESLTV